MALAPFGSGVITALSSFFAIESVDREENQEAKAPGSRVSAVRGDPQSASVTTFPSRFLVLMAKQTNTDPSLGLDEFHSIFEMDVDFWILDAFSFQAGVGGRQRRGFGAN